MLFVHPPRTKSLSLLLLLFTSIYFLFTSFPPKAAMPASAPMYEATADYVQFLFPYYGCCSRPVDEGRRWRSTRPFRGVTEWDYEIGDPPSTTQQQQEASGAGTAGALRPSSLNVSENASSPLRSGGKCNHFTAVLIATCTSKCH